MGTSSPEVIGAALLLPTWRIHSARCGSSSTSSDPPTPSAGSPDIRVLDSFSLFHAISAPEMEKSSLLHATLHLFCFVFFFFPSSLACLFLCFQKLLEVLLRLPVPEGLHPCLLSQSPLPLLTPPLFSRKVSAGQQKSVVLINKTFSCSLVGTLPVWAGLRERR